MEWQISGIILQLVKGDITRQPDLDVIVNAANSSLRGGGGVDGAIHRAAGPMLKEESSGLGPIRPGQAVITGAYNLPNKYVIHCVGPVYGRDKPENILLASCYRIALELAEEKKAESLGFPAISTGVYGYPLRKAARVMMEAIMTALPHLHHIKLLRVVLFGDESFLIHKEVFSSFISNWKRQ